MKKKNRYVKLSVPDIERRFSNISRKNRNPMTPAQSRAVARQLINGASINESQRMLNDLAYKSNITQPQWNQISQSMNQAYMPTTALPVAAGALVVDLSAAAGAMVAGLTNAQNGDKYCYAVLAALMAQLVALLALYNQKSSNLKKLQHQIAATRCDRRIHVR